jgi:hypothetical protein
MTDDDQDPECSGSSGRRIPSSNSDISSSNYISSESSKGKDKNDNNNNKEK